MVDTMTKSSSRVIESLLKRNNNMNWNEFITTIWEEKCMYFPVSTASASANYDDDKGVVDDAAIMTSKTKLASKTKNDDDNPILDEIKNNGWNVLIGLMDGDDNDGNDSNSNSLRPLIFQNLQPLPSKDIQELYGNNLYSAYLAGSSLVWNHVDIQSSFIAKLCQDLQGEHEREAYMDSSTDIDIDDTTRDSSDIDNNSSCGCFPHVYANAYLTPPQSQTVPPHADDRDVFIFQICGRKLWNVYSKIPIKHPYTNEQVGKGDIDDDGLDLDVPLEVLNGPLAFNDYLNEGDVLYIPRGMVHEAKTTNNEFSFHITIAIATHDWTIGGNLLERMAKIKVCALMSAEDLQTMKKLVRTIPNFRKSVVPTTTPPPPPPPPTAYNNTKNVGGSIIDITKIQNQIDNHLFNSAISSDDFIYYRNQMISAQNIIYGIKKKIDAHNIRSSEQRKKLLLLHGSKAKSKSTSKKQQSTTMDDIIGPYAAKNNVSLDTLIRASTQSEREYAKQQELLSGSAASNGLNVRDEIGDEINTIISQIKQQNSGAIKVKDFNKYLRSNDASSSLVCNLTLLCLAKRAVELGAFAIATTTTTTTTTTIEVDDNKNKNDKTSTTKKMKREDYHSSNEVVNSSSKQQKT
ncbi:hypothetical protein FRACYDRAFT_236383 [Fragilariopsis cylindrus CCMP1102]|uniref:Bifunctional lysine-specific demethylase and histidyl-hydroxylase n=1 Tax=Fragilariopsis cylindrus CCMP1102 TaxID=635003 RepID=A0A1E7FQ79_9STRA|nr:hypothetical protein FRACYDRAFT_236383 [Fragilariopsis cylindrus CCMP1102]|eukprot:OEU20308.1 hypothetical protein FRACYDRAFT_236383 [Fragilariopsis cylindrus CCMP1102]